MKILDAFLNGYFVFLALLFVTGGYIPPGKLLEERVTFELSKLDHWVAGFLLLLLVRRLLARGGRAGELGFVRFLRTLGARLVSAPASVYLITAVWAILLAAVAIRRHLAFGGGPNIDIFDQALWNTAHGRFYRSSIVGDVILLSEHFDPLQLLLVPFYLVYPSPAIVLITQAFVLALGAVPLYWMARERFPERDTVRKGIAEAVAALPAKGYGKVLDEDGILVFEKQPAPSEKAEGERREGQSGRANPVNLQGDGRRRRMSIHPGAGRAARPDAIPHAPKTVSQGWRRSSVREPCDILFAVSR